MVARVRIVTHDGMGAEFVDELDVLFYDRAGQLFREQHFEAVREVDGYPFPTRTSVRDRLTGARSVLTFESVRFDVPIPPERFLESAVRRRVRSLGEVLPDASVAPSPGP
jgi:hypothetical protein